MTYVRCPDARSLLSAVVFGVFIVNPVVWADFEFGPRHNLGPLVNSSLGESGGCLSSDGLTMFFASNRTPGGNWDYDLWMTTRSSKDEAWGPASRLSDVLNSNLPEWTPWLTPDGLELYFAKGPVGNTDIYVTRRSGVSEPWSEPENLGPMVNSGMWDDAPSLTVDGLELFFRSSRGGESDLWGEAVSLGPIVNSQEGAIFWGDATPTISPDGLTLFFTSRARKSIKC